MHRRKRSSLWTLIPHVTPVPLLERSDGTPDLSSNIVAENSHTCSVRGSRSLVSSIWQPDVDQKGGIDLTPGGGTWVNTAGMFHHCLSVSRMTAANKSLTAPDIRPLYSPTRALEEQT